MAKEIHPHKKLRKWCEFCNVYHTKAVHRFHGKKAFEKTHRTKHGARFR